MAGTGCPKIFAGQKILCICSRTRENGKNQSESNILGHPVFITVLLFCGIDLHSSERRWSPGQVQRPTARCLGPCECCRVGLPWKWSHYIYIIIHYLQPHHRIAFSRQWDDDRNRFTFLRFIFLSTTTNTKIVFYKETISLSMSCCVNLFASCWSTKYVNPSSDGAVEEWN